MEEKFASIDIIKNEVKFVSRLEGVVQANQEWVSDIF